MHDCEAPANAESYGIVEGQRRDRYKEWTTPIHALRIGSRCNEMAWVEVESEMLDLQYGDRIELFYEDVPETTIRATIGRLLTDREEGMGPEVEDYCACWIEIAVDEPSDMDANQVVLLCTDSLYRLNGRPATLRKTQDQRGRLSGAPRHDE